MQICFMLYLPNELLALIATYLPRESLRILTQVSRLFREVAAPPFFRLLRFEPPQAPVVLNIEYAVLEALSIWRRTNAFILPDSIWFSVTGATTDCHLNVLGVFFESLKGYESFPRVHLQLLTAPRQPTHSFVRLLNCIRVSGCKNLHCHDVQQTYGVPRADLKLSSFTRAAPSCFSKLEVLEMTSSLLFLPAVIPFTVTTLYNSPISRLILKNTSLTAAQWSTLLGHLSMQHLRSLEVDESFPAYSLVTFLARHNVRDLTFSQGHPTISRSSRAPVCLPLPSLERLDGPPACIHSLASFAMLPTTLESLTVCFRRSSSEVPLLEEVLACAAYFPELDGLHVRIPAETDCCLLETPRQPVPSCLVKVLFLMCFDSPKHDIIVRFIVMYTLLLNDMTPDSHTALPGWRSSHVLTDSTYLLIAQNLINN